MNEQDKIYADEDVSGTTVEHWVEWKKVCAADLCAAETASALRSFGAVRFTSYLKRYASRVGHFGSTMKVAEIRDAWHLLETFARVGTTRNGKRYKDWLFQRAGNDADNQLDALEGGATLLMRDVVRDYLRQEHAPSFMSSLNKPVGADDNSALTLEDLLPDNVVPHHEIAEREWLELARQHTGNIFPSLDKRERIAIWARANGISLSDDRLLKWAKCSSSLLYQIHRSCIQRIALEMKKNYRDESPAALVHLACMTLDVLAEYISSKIVLEKGAARFFKVI